MNDDLRAHLIARGEESILQDPSPDSFIHLLIMEVTNFEIIERGCCCFLEIKLISTWNVNKKHMSENTWIVYTVIFFRIGIPWYSSPLNSPPFFGTIFGTFFFPSKHRWLMQRKFFKEFSVEILSYQPQTGQVSLQFRCWHPSPSCGVFRPFVFNRLVFSKHDDRRPTSFQVHEMTFPDGAAPPEAVFFSVFPFAFETGIII